MKTKFFYATLLLLGILSSLNAKDFVLKEGIKGMKMQYDIYSKYDPFVKKGEALTSEFSKVIDKANKLENKMKKDNK